MNGRPSRHLRLPIPLTLTTASLLAQPQTQSETQVHQTTSLKNESLTSARRTARGVLLSMRCEQGTASSSWVEEEEMCGTAHRVSRGAKSGKVESRRVTVCGDARTRSAGGYHEERAGPITRRLFLAGGLALHAAGAALSKVDGAPGTA